ncbi:hypothetical protein PIB30_089683 [Stylosanthes scabra]|uniref:Uncharacterized protein n=1 Tax=Stylosanthes scabra TaxID=79078 RepID=A0ABU6ZTD8_9FABA|nr:hypothetical protein [Stylosanthes scabra]
MTRVIPSLSLRVSYHRDGKEHSSNEEQNAAVAEELDGGLSLYGVTCDFEETRNGGFVVVATTETSVNGGGDGDGDGLPSNTSLSLSSKLSQEEEEVTELIKGGDRVLSSGERNRSNVNSAAAIGSVDDTGLKPAEARLNRPPPKPPDLNSLSVVL